MALIQFIYMSSLLKDEPDVLRGILDTAVQKNKRLGITGMVLCLDRNVMQVLEGEKDVVLNTFNTIQNDARHHRIYVISQDEVAERQFPAWSMGFRRLKASDVSRVPFATDVFKAGSDEISLQVSAGNAREFLKYFGRDLRYWP